MRRTLHVGIHKSLLLQLLANHGAGEVLKDVAGTDEEARQLINADPREFFVLDPTCDRRGPDGSCLGHEVNPPVRADYTREELIAICERAVVPMGKWRNRDSPSAHENLGLCAVMLKAGAPFTIHPPQPGGGCHTDARTIWLTVSWHGFNDFEFGTKFGESEMFYLPTPARLDETAGRDWY